MVASPDTFADGIQYLHEHITDLRKQVSDGPQPRMVLLDVAFETMNSTLEELRVAEEEMRQQNEALASAHVALDTWRRHYEDLFESAPDAYLVTDMNGIVREANQKAADMLGLSKRFLKGKPLATFVPEEARSDFRAFLSDRSRSPGTAEREMRLTPRKSVPIEISITVSVVRDALGHPQSLRWLVRNVTGGLAAEAERYRRVVEEVKDYAIFLLDTRGHVLNWNPGAERILGYTEAEIRGQHFEVLFPPEARQGSVPRRELEKAEREGRSEDVGWHQRKNGERFWANGVTTALRDKSGSLRWYAKVMRDDTARKREEERLAELYDRERRIAEAFQRALLPDVPADAFPGLALATEYEAAWAEAQVGGDFFDAFPLNGGSVALVVGDVSGKGLEAAAHTAEIKYALRAFLRETPQPDRALARLNAFVYDSHRLKGAEGNAFVTLCVLVVIPSTGQMTLSVAGAEPPLILRADGRAEKVEVQGSLLGLVADMEFPAVCATLAPDDTVIVVTDGITEARRDGDFLDYEGLTRLAVESHGKASLSEMARSIIEGARAFTGGALADDACLLLARRVTA